MKKIKNILYSLCSSFLIFPAVAGAQFNPENPDSSLPETEANQLLINIIQWLLSILASLCILMIVVAGIMYITSQGDSGRVETAKKMLIYAIVGLVVALVSYVIVISVGAAIGAG